MMGKVFGVFVIIVFINVLLFMGLSGFFMSDIHLETAIYTFGTILAILLSFLISLLLYLISILEKKL